MTNTLNAEALFKNVLGSTITTALGEDNLLEDLVPYLFYRLFEAYGNDDIYFYIANESHENKSLIFEMDSAGKTAGLPVWVKAKTIADNAGNSIALFLGKPTVYSDCNPPLMEINYYRDREGRGNRPKPFIYVGGFAPEFALGSNDEKCLLSIFLTTLLVKEVFPLNKWAAEQFGKSK